MIKESIFSFLKIRKMPIIIFTGIVVIFGILFYLYDIPFDAFIYVCLLIFTNIINGISYYISTGSSFLTMQNNSQSIWILLDMIIRNLQRNYIRQSRSLFLRIELQKKSCLIIMACGFIRSKHRLLHWIFYCKIRSNFYMKKI